MKLLKKNNELSFDDYLYYVCEFNPVLFKFVRYFAFFIKGNINSYDCY